MLTFKVLPLMPSNSLLASMLGVRGEAKRGIDNAINTIRQVGDNLIYTYKFTLHFDVDNLAFYFYWLVISLAEKYITWSNWLLGFKYLNRLYIHFIIHQMALCNDGNLYNSKNIISNIFCSTYMTFWIWLLACKCQYCLHIL